MAQEAPSAPPEEEEREDGDEERGDRDIRPFFTVRSAAGEPVTVRAGWLDGEGEVDTLVFNFVDESSFADQAFDLAFSWYQTQLQYMRQQGQ